MSRFVHRSFRAVPLRGTVGLLCGFLLVGLSGCGETSMLGRRYDNFSAYYNKFHNAEQAFEEGVQSLEEGAREVDRTEYVSVFLKSQQSRSGGSDSPFEKTIQKSADVLREHPDSKWVDDALLLIGKSYFYQNNYIGAAQKFREAMALETERRREARFWLARTLVTNEQNTAADEVMRVVEASAGPPDDEWTAQLHLVRGELLVQQEQWTAAAEALQRGLAGDVPDGPAARAAFLLGQVWDTLQRPRPARAAYRHVREYDPSYNLALAARLSEIELQGTHDEPDAALDRLDDVASDDKNYEQRGEIALVRARVYRAQGRYDRARKALRSVLYGEEAPSGTANGRLHYDLATLYRDAYKDFSRAAAHFDTASTGLQRGRRQGEAESQRLPQAPVDADEQATRFRDLAERAREVARMDSLLRIGRMDDEEFQAFVAQRRRERQAAREAQAEAQQEAVQSRRFQQRGQALGEQRRNTTPAADTRQSDAGFLFHQDPARVQQGRQRFQETWGDRPRVDNWRRRNAIRSSGPSDTVASSAPEAAPSAGGTTARRGDASVRGGGLGLADIPRDSSSRAKMEAERAVARYELANALFLAAGRPDSAATWYRRILQKNADHPVAKRALYALAESYRAQGDTTAAQQTYQRLLDQYPTTQLATRARKRLDQATAEPADNGAAVADTAYAHAYRQWQNGRWRPALDSMLVLAARYPETKAAPRALLASGIIYWRRAQVDSTRAPRSLLDRHVEGLLERPPDSTVQTASEEPETRSSRARPESGRAAQNARATPVMPDSLRKGAVDSTQTQDAGQAPLQQHSPGSDSLQRAERGRRAGGDAVSETGSVYTPLKTLLNYLTQQYANAPQVKRAQVLLSMIEEQRAAADTALTDSSVVDTTRDEAQPAPDSTTLASTRASTSESAADARPSSRTPPPIDSTAVRPRPKDSTDHERSTSSEREPLPAPTDPNARTAPPDEAAQSNQWTLLVERFTVSRAASAREAEMNRTLTGDWVVDLIPGSDPEKREYLLVIGRFSSEEEAVKARTQLQDQISGSLEVYRRVR